MIYRPFFALSLILALACGGATTVPLESTPHVPAALAKIELERGDNQNTVGTLTVEHLAPPQELRTDLTVYVTWVRPSGARDWQNVGQLMVGEDRAGSLEMRVPYDQFDLSVSAESTGDVSTPSQMIVLQGQVDVSQQS